MSESSPDAQSIVAAAAAAKHDLETALFQVKRVIVGQEHMLERVLVALLAGGHILLEGVPGLAKTLTIKTVAEVLGGQWNRIQFTPDLVPSDLVGTRIYRQATGEFETELGPVFCNFLLADEINRAPAKVQSALLEVMQEHQVTIGHDSHRVPEPYLVMATQNPIESEGTYPLPEDQVDRFMMKLVVNYPSFPEELEVVRRALVGAGSPQEVLTIARLLELQAVTDQIYVDRQVAEYAVRLTMATRAPDEHGAPELVPNVAYGASPRGSINLVRAAQALALIRGRTFALPQDIQELALDVLRHRLVLTYSALAEEVTADRIITTLLGRVPMPQIDLAHRASA
jgi:MoxR-like ATPase